MLFGFFGHEACGIPAPQPETEPAPHALEGKVFTTGPPGICLVAYLLYQIYYIKLLNAFCCFCVTSDRLMYHTHHDSKNNQ